MDWQWPAGTALGLLFCFGFIKAWRITQGCWRTHRQIKKASTFTVERLGEIKTIVVDPSKRYVLRGRIPGCTVAEFNRGVGRWRRNLNDEVDVIQHPQEPEIRPCGWDDKGVSR